MSDKQKEIYETLDSIGDALENDHHSRDELAVLVFALTGYDSEARFDPDAESAARGTCLRWLRDHGYLERKGK